MITDEMMIAAVKAYTEVDVRARPAALRAALEAATKFVRPYHDIQPSDWRSMVPKDFFRLAWKAMIAAAPEATRHD